jgi:TPP-dependent pyruvate/acetoin dehydrogenase alpha subunit/pyruvate/2-oxoglutarate/acetoin dehydrogenase E1 component
MPETAMERRRTPRMLLSPAGKILDTTALHALGLTAEAILTMYRHMLLTRIFCDAANANAHRGQLALFISSKGQEAAEVGSACALAAQDWIFWYLRTWGAALTRGVTSTTLFQWLYGLEDRQVVEHLLAHHSMLPYILVGNHLPHATGFAASKMMQGEDAVSLAYFGDGATSTADFHGAANFAAIHHLPIVFFCHNNGVAVSTPLVAQTAVPIYQKARAYGFPGVLVDGRDPFAVYDATQKALRRARDHRGPTLIEAVVDRLDPHTTAIGVEQRTTQEIADMQRRDPLHRMRRFLLSPEAHALCDVVWSDAQDRALQAQLEEEVRAAVDIHLHLGDAAQRRQDGIRLIDRACAVYAAPAVKPAYRAPHQTDRARLEPDRLADVNCCDAYGMAIHDIFHFDARAIYLGEDIGTIGGVFRNVGIHKDLLETLGLERYRNHITVNYVALAAIFTAHRFIDTPLDEYGTAGIAVGLALDGRTVFLEAQFSGFVYAMMNHIVAHMARFRQRSAGCVPQSVTVVLPYGGGLPLIEHHREEEVAPFLNIPGITIACPATPQEFYDLAWAAAASEKPVLLFLPKLLYRDSSLRAPLRRRLPEHAIEDFGARIAYTAPAHDTGGVTVVTFGRMISAARDAAQRAAQQGIPVEVLALRTLKPLPRDDIFHSVTKTKRLVTVEEAPVSGGFGEHVVANVTSDPTMLATLWATPRCVGAPAIDPPPVPYYASYIPQAADILRAIETTFKEEF